MQFALINGDRVTAQPNRAATCPCCDAPLVARCGEERAWHWAHKGQRHCDRWWENETNWHIAWKDRFPADWQEYVHRAEDGERHIADVRTGDGWAIEFQHSYIKPEERRSREAFYPRLTWVVDGLRRGRDKARFLKSWDESSPVSRASPVRSVWSGEGALFRDWVDSRAHVFFDLGEEEVLWWLSPISDDMWAFVARVSREEFIRAHRRTTTEGADGFDAFVAGLDRLIPEEEVRRQAQRLEPPPPPRPQQDIFLLLRNSMAQRRHGRGRYRRW